MNHPALRKCATIGGPASLLSVILAASFLSCHPGARLSAVGSALIVVAPDGSGDFRTVQEAFNAIPDSSSGWTEIVLRPGVYREKVTLPASKRRVILRAQKEGSAILTFDDHTGRVVGTDTINTRTSFSCSLDGDDIRAEGIVFRNTAGRVGQAVALQITGDRVVLDRCKILGDQDTFFARGIGRIFLRDCEIEGTTDFIFGSAIVLFDRCLIRSKKDSYVTAASTPEGNRFGFVFRDCTLTADDTVGKVYLGRPWRPFARTVFLRCELGPHILPAGWHNWSKPDAERTAYYGEYECSGPGSGRSARVPWSKELTDDEAAAYTSENIFAADAASSKFQIDWLP